MAQACSAPNTDAYTEERTEPFSQSEMEARLRDPAPHIDAHRATVPLDALQVDDSHQGIRLLVRDLTNWVTPRRDNSVRWVALRAEVASVEEPEHQVLAVTQTHKDTKFSVRIPSEPFERPHLWFDLYYDPASDNQILYNRSDEPVTLIPFSRSAPNSPAAHDINPNSYKALAPGTWRISVRGSAVLDFRILEKRPFTVTKNYRPAPTTGKRSFNEFDNAPDNSGGKKRKPSDPLLTTEPDQQEGVVMFLRKAVDPLFPLAQGGKSNGEGSGVGVGVGVGADDKEAKGKQISTVVAHPLMDMKENETAHIPGAHDLDEAYQITKRDHIAASPLSTVYTAQHSGVQDCIITVKVLRTSNGRPQSSERDVIIQADTWSREFRNQDGLKHESIVRLHGGDARFLSLYMEHIDAKDLAYKSEWRSPVDDAFLGTRTDAAHILNDIAGALQYLHKRRLVHNDIKPANILYSRERRAMLCDFGLTSPTSNPAAAGGTPYYVPPEFIGIKQRGLPSDVWALGVVMLYLVGKISLPEARGNRHHPKRLHWQIAEVNRPPRHAPTDGNQPMAARLAMQMWLNEVMAAKESLDLDDWLERTVAEMLMPNPKQRITTQQIRARFEREEGRRALRAEMQGPNQESLVEVEPDVDTATSSEVAVVA